MTSLILKLIIYPLTIFFSNYIFTSINFAYTYQWILLGIILAVVSHILDLFFLRPRMLWMNNLLDFFAAVAIIYVSQFIFAGETITLLGASLVAVLLNVIELLQHLYLIKSGKTKKTQS